MPEMNITVRNKIATKTDNVVYVCGNSDYVINFDFDSEWDAYDAKTAQFNVNGKHIPVVFTGNQCKVPVITNTYAFHAGVFAGDLHTTTAARVPCRKCILCGAGAPADPPESVYDQLMELIKGMGGADPEAIEKAVADYLAAHPIEETDPTVPEWAKAETKPTYSAAEVGAISQSDLQAATNAALAQAKSSGEFDGATGPAGPQGPAGAPGKDGAGMDITGATVGQIAKIAAVDASGVPTAWSPADMPSGGGGETWELIRSLELSADVVKVVINEDNAGNAFVLKKAYIRIAMAIPTDTSITSARTVCVDTVAADPWGTGKVVLGTSPSISDKSKRYCFLAFETFAGKFLPIFIKASYGATVPDVIVSGKQYDEKGAITLKDGDIYGASPCKSLCFGSYHSCLYAGTTIEIYGVRE